MIAAAAFVYLVIVNIAAFWAYGSDKRRARHEHWRIPENALLTFSLLGGAVGSLAGMRVFHHKTRKPRFRYGVPAVLILHILMITAAIVYFYIIKR